MAVRALTLVDDGRNIIADPVATYQWTGLTQTGSDTGAPLTGMGWSDRSVQVEGTFGTGGTVVIEGSNNGTNYHTLRDPFSVVVSFTSADLKQVTEITKYIRPRVTGGDGSTSLTVTILVRTQRL